MEWTYQWTYLNGLIDNVHIVYFGLKWTYDFTLKKSVLGMMFLLNWCFMVF